MKIARLRVAFYVLLACDLALLGWQGQACGEAAAAPPEAAAQHLGLALMQTKAAAKAAAAPRPLAPRANSTREAAGAARRGAGPAPKAAAAAEWAETDVGLARLRAGGPRPEAGAAGSARLTGLTGLAGAAATVVSVSVDDVMWFLPFAVHRRRGSFILFYVLCSQFVVLLAALYFGADALLGWAWPSVPVYGVVKRGSASLLLVYAVVLFRQWCLEEQCEEEPEAQMVEKVAARKDKEQPRTLTQLFVITICGSLDNLVVYVSLLMLRTVAPSQLVVGALLGSAVVVLICLGAGLVKPLVSFVEQIPLWCVLLAVCTWSAIGLARAAA